MTTTTPTRLPLPLLIDQLAAHPDLTRTTACVVRTDPATAYRTVRERPAPRSRLWERPGWSVLGERPGAELVFGSILPSRSPARPRELEARDFVDFALPGHLKVACSLSVLPYGQCRALVTCEFRVTATDPRSWQRLRHGRGLISPLLGLLQRAILRSVRRDSARSRPR
ncbi:hypothetical protein JOF41_001886 [Saccharothrix coeruleofusca]|uniref:hypothetical protein n=1 Tax=Saccharothrix coeruleofusca TaxID=33919 RepID=UPI001AE7A453|nr:hypothetical protein [Saccharothrix coeruleofusca]MBP2335708.1 hypothetical protein [Saccharothrix coeruleofusca]